jgi:hypothetical protein
MSGYFGKEKVISTSTTPVTHESTRCNNKDPKRYKERETIQVQEPRSELDSMAD